MFLRTLIWVVEEVSDYEDLRHFEPLESSLPQPETLVTKGVESDTVLETTAERIKDYLQKDQQRTEDSLPDSVVEPEEGETKETPSEPLSKDDPELKNAPDGFSEGRPIPELTFDAVTSDDEDTWKVTPYDEEDEESDKFEYQQDEEIFNIVSGGERIAHVAGSEEDDEDDDEGEMTPEESPKIEEPKESEEAEQPHELIFEEPADSNFSEDAVKVPDEDSQTLQFEDESEEGDIEPSTPPADEASPFEHTEEALAENLTVDDSPVPKQLSKTDMLSDFDTVGIQPLQTSSINDLNAECLGNVIRLSVAPHFEEEFEVDAVFNNTKIIHLTPGLATQCGFSFKFDPMGNAMFFASLQNCFSRNMDDKMFSLVIQFRLPGNHLTEDPVYRVGKTCSYTRWSSREILCDRNYMEVSVRRTLPDIQTFPEQPIGGPKARSGDLRRGAEAVASGYKMTAVVFSPSKKVMKVDEVQRKGYAIANTPTRLVLRSPHNAEETYLQNVAGVPMRVLSTSTFFAQKWLVTRVDATAVCPTPGAVEFTPEVITWYMPRHIDPLISSDAFTMLEVYMGIDAKRLDTEEMAARNYSVLVTEAHIIVEIPVGAVGGYFKSHIQDNQYFVTYTIEPMLELLWIEEVAHEDTRYKVLFPITTPPMARPPQVRNYTPLDAVPEQAVFVFELGTFNLDVALLNITFPTVVLTVAECNARGFNVQEQRSLDNTLKTFRMEVPFSDPVVFQEKRPEQGVTTFTLQLIYGLVILPEYTTFSHSAVVDAVLLDIGTKSPFFVVLVGKRLLSNELAQQYLTEGDANFTITLPFSSPDAVFESVHSSSVRSRLDVALLNPYNNMTLKYFSLACSFLKTLTECFSNGTMTALAVKVETAPSLNPGLLTLSDPACGPTYSDDRFAYFHFTVNSCGTTRKFINNVMLYENEISLPDELEVKINSNTSSAEEYQ
ncbi:hypothetical protein J4Q44_G00317660 [Coregonus suidteri]|uniref:ZP domain-containing protein n=1 Tax=Coregonus suidteri TaxID=861788 RepID=A0AAN8QHS3_9TELE